MGNKNQIVAYLFSIFILGSCSDKKALELKDYFAEGRVDPNNLEQGTWKFYDTDGHKLNQQGHFSNGLRVGWWQYYSEVRDSIFWLEVYSKDSTLKTNIPGFLVSELEEPGFIAFSHKDPSKTLKVKVGFQEVTGFNPENYNNLVVSEVAHHSISVSSREHAIVKTTCGDEFYFNKFSGIDSTHKVYVLWTINRIQNDTQIEVTVRCGIDLLLPGENVFDAVISNLFVNGERFLDKNISCELIRTGNVKYQRRFSFGCN